MIKYITNIYVFPHYLYNRNVSHITLSTKVALSTSCETVRLTSKQLLGELQISIDVCIL